MNAQTKSVIVIPQVSSVPMIIAADTVDILGALKAEIDGYEPDASTETGRKFTDKDGAEREITEVVLRPYRGELTLIGGRQEDRNGDERPAKTGQASRSSEAAPGRESPATYAPDLDDDIPF